MQKPLVAILFFVSMAFRVIAQQTDNPDALQQQRDQLRKEIDATEQQLKETRKSARVNIGQLTLINKKMDLQGNVIDNINHEIRSLNDNMYLAQKEINRMSRVLDTLKEEYANSMVYAYKNRNNYDLLNFIFSSSSFNDAVKRIEYLKFYRSYREMQADNILRTQKLLNDRIQLLSITRQKKNVVLKEQDKEMDKLEKQQEEKKAVVDKLKGQQKELMATIAAKRKQDAKLKNMITAMIKRQMEEEARKEKAARLAEAKNNSAAKNNTAETKTSSAGNKSAGPLVSTEADKVLDANFERNKGSLPWPVSGYVIEHYGPNKVTDRVDYLCPGVNIGAQVGQSVKAVFEGDVTAVSYMDDKQVVFIKHGKYYTVYSNLASASVQRGEHVQTGQVIGKVGSNDDGQGELDFVLMNGLNNVNPEQWLRH